MMGWLFDRAGFEQTYLTDEIIPAFGTDLAGSDLRHHSTRLLEQDFQGPWSS